MIKLPRERIYELYQIAVDAREEVGGNVAAHCAFERAKKIVYSSKSFRFVPEVYENINKLTRDIEYDPLAADIPEKVVETVTDIEKIANGVGRGPVSKCIAGGFLALGMAFLVRNGRCYFVREGK